MKNKKLAKMNAALWWRHTSRLALVPCAAVLAASCLQSCEKDVLTGQPQWLGNSIYERLEEGIMVDNERLTFETTLRLIDDLDLTTVLSKTGSKTLFVTSDKAYDEWFKSNEWGVRSYDQLSLTQKKILLNNSMIDNAYLLELMSNVSGNPPLQGMCMRRESSMSIYDSIPTMTVDEMPVNPLGRANRDTWTTLRNNGKTVRIMKDATTAPMIHFLPGFMAKNNILSSDLYVLSNGESNSISDSWINGRRVISNEQTCKNGYVYVVDGVIESNKSMAEIVNGNPQTTLWSKLLMRFAVPEVASRDIQENYRRLYNTTDTVYNLRYFNSEQTHGLLETPQGVAVRTGTLKFDPGWNHYIYTNSMNYDMHYDAGAMIVPTDEALNEWWTVGSGRALREEYGSWDKVPYATIAELLNVNLLKSFVDAVPSKFRSVLDDAKVELGINAEEHIEHSYMGCNGVVYLTNTVFAPSSFRSVFYPALAHQSSTFSVMYQAIVDYDFKPYLNSMDSKFSLLLPLNTKESENGKEQQTFLFLDPCTYGSENPTVFEFYKDEETDKIAANRYRVSMGEDGSITIIESLTAANDEMIQNRLEFLIDNLIIVDKVWESGHEYYKTKGGSVIRVQNGSDDKNIAFSGGYQMETGTATVVDQVYDMLNRKSGNDDSALGNGKTYAVGPEANGVCNFVPLTASKSVYQVLQDRYEAGKDTLFFKLLSEDVSEEATEKPFLISANGSYACADDSHNKNIRLFENYNYTVYVPTDASIKALTEGEDACLPSWDDYNYYNSFDESTHTAEEIAEAKIICKEIATIIHDFVRYHFQDNSVYINGTNGAKSESYESGKLNPLNKRFYSLAVTVDDKNLTVKDYLSVVEKDDRVSHVLTGSDNIWNKTCCEYWFTGKMTSLNRNIFSASHIVMHEVDAPLFFSKDQKTSWKSRAQAAVQEASKKD